MKMHYQAAVFDLDGTLLDTLTDLYPAPNAALAAFGYPPRTREDVRAFVGNGVGLLIHRALPAATPPERESEVLAFFREYYAAHCREATAPYTGIPALLRALRDAGVRVAVVSNKFDAAVKDLCRAYFGDAVEVAVGESPTVRRKPAPDAVLSALRTRGVPLSGAVYIGDSDVDIATAAAAGLPCISVLWGFRDRDFLAAHGAATYAATAEELRALL
mgnify:CR=1 FL=1